MSTSTVARASHGTLAGTVVDTVIFTANYQTVLVINRGADHIYVTTDGTTPTIAGDDCMVVPPLMAVEMPVLMPTTGTAPSTSTVNLISATVVPYSVTVATLKFDVGGGGGGGGSTSTPVIDVDISGKLDKPLQALDGLPLRWDYATAQLKDASAAIVSLVTPQVLAGVPATIVYDSVAGAWPARSTKTTDPSRRVCWIGTATSGQPTIDSTYAKISDELQLPEA